MKVILQKDIRGKGKKGQEAKALTQKEKANLIANLEKEMKEASRRLGVPFGIVDLSLAPTPAVGDSVAHILEEMGLEQCGALRLSEEICVPLPCPFEFGSDEAGGGFLGGPP